MCVYVMHTHSYSASNHLLTGMSSLSACCRLGWTLPLGELRSIQA